MPRGVESRWIAFHPIQNGTEHAKIVYAGRTNLSHVDFELKPNILDTPFHDLITSAPSKSVGAQLQSLPRTQYFPSAILPDPSFRSSCFPQRGPISVPAPAAPASDTPTRWQ